MGPLALAALLVVLDDGEKIPRDKDHTLPPSPWPADIALFAMRGETIALQAIVESADRLRGIHATFGTFAATGGRKLAPEVQVFAEHFVKIVRPSGNEKYPGSLAFTAEAAPDPGDFAGYFADPLVPGDTHLDEGDRAALWIDLTVPKHAEPGFYESILHVSSTRGVIGARTVTLRVLDREMPWAAQRTMVYYEPNNLERRMGDRAAEIELRQMLHAHHASAIREVRDTKDMGLDDEALSGELFTTGRGYAGPGEGLGEGVFAIGAYGALGAPTREHLGTAARVAEHLASRGRLQDTQVFLYAIDEACSSLWGGEWLDLVHRSDAMRGIKVGVTCGDDPMAQRADLLMMTARDYVPERARVAKHAGKWLWAYNGQRPYAGPLMLDVPAIDLRANAWIAARYGIERWFYWESTYWFDDIHGGRGGPSGFDPFVIAETFHNASGDWANGDGILLYPGKQILATMKDFGQSTVFPSVRLKNLRRGIQDAAYIDAARNVDREAADAIVRRLVPSALANAGRRASWPDRGGAWLEARRELASVFERASRSEMPISSSSGSSRTRWGAALFLVMLGLFVLARRAKLRRG